MTKKIAILLFLLFFSYFSYAQLAMNVEPVEGEGVISMYPFELKEFRLTLVNVSDSEIENVQVLISVPAELSIVVDGADKTEKLISFVSMQANEKKETIFKIKALQNATKALPIRADFGFNEITNSLSAFVKVEKSPVSFDARLNKTSLGPNQDGVVFLDLKNNSLNKITDIHAELLSGDSILINSPAFELASLEAGQRISETEFNFQIGSNTGDQLIVLRLIFDDSKGKHILERAFSLDVQNRDIYVALLVGVIVVLVMISLYMRRSKPTTKVDVQGVKVDILESKK